MLRSHSFATLFPYTTLFRSLLDHLLAVDLEVREVQQQRVVLVGGALEVPLVLGGEVLGLGVHPQVLVVGEDQDRKSTRLNSSHVAISYAVFCLHKNIIFVEG